MSPKPKPYLTIPQLAAMLGESRTAVYTRAKKYGHVNGIPAIEKTPSQLVFSRVVAERAIAGETTAPEPPALPWDVTVR